MSGYRINKFPKSRIATVDVCEIGRKKHHVAAFLEVDVTISRDKIKKYKKDKGKISFMAWLIKVIGHTVSENKSIAAYLYGKSESIIFNDINVSFLIEKDLNGEKVPIPLLIEKANELEIEIITSQLNTSKQNILTKEQIVLQKKTTRLEKYYYYMPGAIRRLIWRYLLKHPKKVFSKMGNIAITSLGMYGKISGWFIPISIHPVCFGIGSIIKKPIVIDDKIEIREIMNMTILMDHDITDGAHMARFINMLTKNIEKGIFL